MREQRTITHANRREIVDAVAAAPIGSRVSLRGPRRTTEQNALMWVLLTAFSDQVEHFGRKYDPETWKCIFMNALGKEIDFVPSLDGESIVALGYRSSELDKMEMSNLIELLFAEGGQRQVDFDDARRLPSPPLQLAPPQ
jgi:hypothetical protein